MGDQVCGQNIPRQALLPQSSRAPGEVFGFDGNSYVLLGFYDPPTLRLYGQLSEAMEECALSQPSATESFDRVPGVECIVDYPGRRGGKFCRGVIIHKIPENDRYVCYLPDECIQVEVHGFQVLPTNPSVTAFPEMVARCKLADLECFLGTPYLRDLYGEFMKNEWIVNVCSGNVEIVNRGEDAATIRFVNRSDTDLSEALQLLVPTYFRVEYPPFGRISRVKVTTITNSGIIWFQPEINLMRVIKKRLRAIHEGLLPIQKDWAPEEHSWRSLFTTGHGEIFLYKRSDRLRVYRVRILQEDQNGAVIYYVDYGEIEIIADSSYLFPARRLDFSLCLIPPQCLPLRFTAAHCNWDGRTAVDKHKFWKYVEGNLVAISLHNLNFASFDVSNVVPSHLLDPVFSFIPPECFPRTENEWLLLNHFWMSKRAVSVKTILSDPALFKFNGDVCPPEADVLVNLDPEKRGRGDMESLCVIYHTREYCALHGPRHNWDDGIQTATSESTTEMEADCSKCSSSDEGLGGSSSPSTPPIYDKTLDTYVYSNWISTTLQQIQDDENDGLVKKFKSGLELHD